MHCLFYLVMENSWFINLMTDCFVPHALGALFDLFVTEKLFLRQLELRAGASTSSLNQLDW